MKQGRFGFLMFLSATTLQYIVDGSQDWRLTVTILRAATHEPGRRDHDICLSRSHYTEKMKQAPITINTKYVMDDLE